MFSKMSPPLSAELFMNFQQNLDLIFSHKYTSSLFVCQIYEMCMKHLIPTFGPMKMIPCKFLEWILSVNML